MTTLPRRSDIATGETGRGAALTTILLLALASGTFLVLLWNALCAFPWFAWNDMRLAPAVAFAQGWSVYPTRDAGVINTWSYGPLPLLYFLPASWASNAANALMVAGIMNAALTIVPLAAICFGWPAFDTTKRNWLARGLAFVLCCALWPERHYTTLFADNLAIACGLLGNLMLVRARHPAGFWFSAFAGCAALACKQITLGIVAAQVIWIGLTFGRSAAGKHLVRCVVAAVAVAGIGILLFGLPGLWFTLVELPAHFPWQTGSRFGSALPGVALQLFVPGLIIYFWRREFGRGPLLLAALAWACAAPMGIAALFKLGGWLNSLHSLAFWLPPTLVAACTAQRLLRQRWFLSVGAATAAFMMLGRVALKDELVLRPELANYRTAEALAARYPQQIWFPTHPLITLYSEGRYYHDDDGLWVRIMSGHAASVEHVAAHLPAALRIVASRADWVDWGMARTIVPSPHHVTELENWRLLTWETRLSKP